MCENCNTSQNPSSLKLRFIASSSFQNTFHLFFQIWKVIDYDFPNNFNIYSEIFVNYHVPKSNDPSPRDIRILISVFLWYIPSSFTNYSKFLITASTVRSSFSKSLKDIPRTYLSINIVKKQSYITFRHLPVPLLYTARASVYE